MSSFDTVVFQAYVYRFLDENYYYEEIHAKDGLDIFRVVWRHIISNLHCNRKKNYYKLSYLDKINIYCTQLHNWNKRKDG